MYDDRTIRILLVEDNTADARLIREMLGEGHAGQAEVIHASGAQEAMKLLTDSVGSADAFDIVLLDLSMPDSSWMATFGRMHAIAPEVPIVVLTGLDDDRLAVSSVREGAQDYLVKSDITPGQLGRAIRLAIERDRVTHDRATSTEQAHFEAAFEGINQGLIVAERNWVVTIANPTARALFGSPEQDCRGHSLMEMLKPFALSVPLDQLSRSQDPLSTFTIDFDRGTRQADARLTRLFDPPGTISSLVLLLRPRVPAAQAAAH
jgi:DNA-binding NarL/FixJ family response regulator